ncbi:hypothetical protein HYV80_01275 [Candidatus Woesearchaeota archaeon]|nr:hypothetical protein [Candidatus Woesearchaeota archaeon]
MSEKERLDILKGKLLQLEKKARKLNSDKNILSSTLDESNRGTNARLTALLDDIDLKEEISYLNDWVKFYEEKSAKCLDRIKSLEEAPQQEEKKEAGERETEERLWKDVLKTEAPREKWPKKQFFKEAINKEATSKKQLIRYAIPFAAILLIIASLLLLKPSITGNVALDREIAYTENLNLQMNESGEYNWTLKNPGVMKSLKASGSVTGNGTVKVYIEKDGKRQLIYQNK